jgi:pyruvate dehydrogenase E1 component alpha subunit
MMDEVPMIQLLNPEGERVSNSEYESSLTPSEILGLYRDMAIIRRLCNEATSLQRQGQLALWAPVQGQEAAQIGAGHALAANDFSFPSYREHGIAWKRGVPPLDWLRLFRGVTMGGWDPVKYRHSNPTIVIGNQALNAVGYAMGIQRDAADEAVMTFFGDGGSSQGDIHEACVFAGVFNAPVVFFIQNNHWAISEPTIRQTRIPLFHRASGYGFPGMRVDGNDVLAVYEVTKRALDNARSGNGPSLIEAFTYRMGAHTTSDDPTRYRLEAELETWRLRDPLERVKSYLVRSHNEQQSTFDDIAAEADQMALDLREGLLSLPDPAPLSMFDNVYAEPHPFIEAGRRELIDLGFGGDA